MNDSPIFNDLVNLSQDEFEKAYQKIKERVTAGINPSENPTAIVLGGLPGSGKGNIYGIAEERFNGDVVAVDCDKFREFHPNIVAIVERIAEHEKQTGKEQTTMAIETNPFIFAVSDRLVDELSEEKYNMVIESSLKSSYTALHNASELPQKGYTVELAVMATAREVAWQGTIDRYEEDLAKGVITARKVDKPFFDSVVNGLPDALDEVYKSGAMANIQVFNRQKNCLYDMSKTPDLNPKSMVSAIMHSRPMNLNETTDIPVKKDYISKLHSSNLSYGIGIKNGGFVISVNTSDMESIKKLLAPPKKQELHIIEVNDKEIEQFKKSGISFKVCKKSYGTAIAVDKKEKEKAENFINSIRNNNKRKL